MLFIPTEGLPWLHMCQERCTSGGRICEWAYITQSIVSWHRHDHLEICTETDEAWASQCLLSGCYRASRWYWWALRCLYIDIFTAIGLSLAEQYWLELDLETVWLNRFSERHTQHCGGIFRFLCAHCTMRQHEHVKKWEWKWGWNWLLFQIWIEHDYGFKWQAQGLGGT